MNKLSAIGLGILAVLLLGYLAVISLNVPLKATGQSGRTDQQTVARQQQTPASNHNNYRSGVAVTKTTNKPGTIASHWKGQGSGIR